MCTADPSWYLENFAFSSSISMSSACEGVVLVSLWVQWKPYFAKHL